jgi:hypothetical protein
MTRIKQMKGFAVADRGSRDRSGLTGVWTSKTSVPPMPTNLGYVLCKIKICFKRGTYTVNNSLSI